MGSVFVYIIIGVIIIYLIFRLFVVSKMKNMAAQPENEKIINLGENNISRELSGSIALVDFWADWCMPCKMMIPVLNQLADEVQGVKICKVNIDQERNLAAKYSVRSIPTMILFVNGKETERFIGVKQLDFLKKNINKHINKG